MAISMETTNLSWQIGNPFIYAFILCALFENRLHLQINVQEDKYNKH
jgi:hypothetical protein